MTILEKFNLIILGLLLVSSLGLLIVGKQTPIENIRSVLWISIALTYFIPFK